MRTIKLISLVLLSAVLTLLVLIPIEEINGNKLSKLYILDNSAQSELASNLKKALFAYGIVRSINAAVSVIQESTINISPVGVGIDLALGQALDPVNDLAERFSWVILLATTSLTIQSLILEIFSSHWFDWIFPLISVLAIFRILNSKRQEHNGLISKTIQIVVVLAILRIFIPAIPLATQFLVVDFLEEKYENSIKEVKVFSSQMKEVNFDKESMTKEEEESWWSTTKKAFSSLTDASLIFSQIKKLGTLVEDWAKACINIIAIFILETILTPILVLYGFAILIRKFSKRDFVQPLNDFMRKNVIKAEEKKA